MSDSDTAMIFVSYCRQDFDQVNKLYHMLKGAGYRPWLDKYDILAGRLWEDEIKKAVKECDFFLACISEHSVDRRGVIQKEIKFALDRWQEKLPGDIYLIPIRLADVELPESLNKIQWVDLHAEDGFHKLKRSLESQGFPGFNKPATPAPKRWKTVRDIRRPILDLISPCYILDSNFHFLDWNSAFDELVARPLSLRRGEHALEFIRQLENCRDVIERSKQTFQQGTDPLVDMELLHFTTERYGMVLFQKLATQIVDESGNAHAWCVHLNVLMAEQLQLLWDDLKARLERDLNWSRYAVSYDRLLTPFDDYQQLVDQVVQLTQDAHRCIDLGAGTGNGTIRLLQSRSDREVWALEPNEAMLECLRTKVRQLDEETGLEAAWPGGGRNGQDCTQRLTIIKGDIFQSDTLPAGHFDGAILINVLYTLENPVQALRQIYRLLRPGGVLVLSTPHQETDVERLFGRLREVLTTRGLFEELRPNYEAARRIHERLLPQIHRDSKADVRRYLREAGFVTSDAPEDWREHEYVDSVLVARAWKV